MSLINDALKRASQTAKDTPTHADVPAPMQPVEEVPQTKLKLLFAAGPVLVVGLAFGGWLLLQRFYQSHAPPPRPPVIAGAAVPRPVVTQPPSAPLQARPPDNAVIVKQSPSPAATAPAAVAIRTAPAPVVTTLQTTPPRANPPSLVIATPQPPRVQPPASIATQPPYSPQSTGVFPKLQVKGIFYNKSRPYALINGDAVGEGERVMGVTVKKILPTRVVVEWNGQTKQLIFGE